MSLLSLDLKFKESFIISTILHFTITSDSNFKVKLSLELFPSGESGDAVGTRDRDQSGAWAHGKFTIGSWG